MLPKDKREEHILNLIKVRTELRKAVNAYKLRHFNEEMYHVIRAQAIAEALGISSDEFFEHKRFVELEEEMQDTLLMGHSFCRYENDDAFWVFTETDDEDHRLELEAFGTHEAAKRRLDERIDYWFDTFGLTKEDSNDWSRDKCKEEGYMFLYSNSDHGEIEIKIREVFAH